MGRAPCCDKKGVKRGIWAPEEDQILVSYIQQHGHGNWRALPEQAGLLRCGKSCRLRWINYLQPDIKRGNFTAEEEETIMKMHEELGNRWSAIAAKLPGRTDNEVKNHWRTNLHKRVPNKTVEANATTNESLSTEENPTITQSRQHSEEPSQTVTTNGTSQTVATNATSQAVAANATSATASEGGADGKKSEVVLYEDFWADVLSDSSFSLDIESGFEVQSMSSLSAPFMGDVATISETWWPGDDNLDCCLGSSSDTAHQ